MPASTTPSLRWRDRYAQRLEQSGVPVELYNTEGTMHGFDIVLDSPIVRACVDRRVAFLDRIFSR